MNPTQIVFLFDLNAFSDVRPKSGPELHHKMLCLRLSCLRILTHYCTAVNLKWGFKFFDSCGKITQTMRKFSFPTVSLESYETLENEISVQYQRHASYLEALAVPSEQNTTPSNNESVICSQDKKLTTQVQLLQLALNEILCEFQWESIDAFSPCVKSRNLRKGEKRNLLFLITRCAISDDEFQEFFGSDYASMTSVKLTKLLLSQSLQEQLLEKASILWIWLNTSENQIAFEQYKPEVLKSLSDALKSIQCAVIPLSVLSQPTQILKFEKEMEGHVSEKCKVGEVYSSIVPFSTLFLQSISYPFYMNESEESSEPTICFLQKDAAVPVIINKVPFQWNRKKNNLSLQGVTSTGETSSDIVSRLWTKFTVHFAVPKHVQVKACDMFLCLPNVSKDISSCKKLQDLIKSLFSNNINLFLICESVCGTVRPGLFSPLSDTSAVISILDRKACFFLNETNLLETDEQFKVMSSLEIRKKIEKNVQSLTIDMNDKMDARGDLHKVSNPILKPFQMECLESWFEPASSAFSILSEIQQQQDSSSSAVDAFHSKLFKSLKKKDLEEDLAQPSKSPEKIKDEVTDEICKDISYDQLIAMLTEIYDAALDSAGSVLHSAKKIIKLASSFFLQKSITSYEDSMKNFMAEFFYTTCRKLTEKYDMSQDPDSTMKIINECQMQVFLALEMEMLFPSLDGSSCVNTVTTFLRTMSFFSGATELNKFLSEVLKINYSQNLHTILVEVGDELDIPFDPEDDSLDEPLSFASSFPDIFDSAFSSTLSVKSSSSTTSSKSENRRLHRKRSDISDMHKSRQVLLPAKSPRKKKTKTHTSGTDGIAIRCSPRLASKKKKEKFKTMDNKTETVRRILFPRDKKLQTPRTSRSSASPLKKKRPLTPKGHHVLKTKFVAETPAHKQKHSALQRRKSLVNLSPRGVTLKEIAESPTIAKCSRDGTSLGILQKLKERCAALSSTSSAKSLPSCSSHPPHTPESKRRLSLKLFSKLLTSPTARMGLKKCSKRLFDQVSPQVNTQSKKIKLSRYSQDSKESSEEM